VTGLEVVADRLRHYSGDAVVLDRSRAYPQEEPRMYTKPVGFWVSVLGEQDWPSWCREEYTWARLDVEHVVTLRPSAEILLLDSIELLDAFTKTYGIVTHRKYSGGAYSEVSIDWPRVSSEYDGIVVAPYQWERRMGLDWYYTWDVASGCIWNLEAIEGVTALAASEVLS
jgi:hypothetical protein